MRSPFFLLFSWLIAGAATFLEAQTAPSWSGRWQGTLVSLPIVPWTHAAHLYVDDGPGGRLSAQLLGEVLISPLKVGKVLLVMPLRVRGYTLEIDHHHGIFVTSFPRYAFRSLEQRQLTTLVQTPTTLPPSAGPLESFSETRDIRWLCCTVLDCEREIHFC